MKATCSVLSVAALGAVLTLPAAAQQAKKPAAPPVAPEAMAMPKPGPEHDVLKREEGTWDATVESWMAPGPPMVSKGVETNALLGGMWLVSDFKSELMGTPFLGHGVAGWDPGKKKYVSTWVDSMSTGLSLGESTYDPASKTLTGWMEGPDIGPTSQVSKMKSVMEQKDADTRVFSMYGPGPEGQLAMRITYKRRK